MNRWERWERSSVLMQRAIDLSEQASKERDEFRWWLTATAIALALAVLAATGDAPGWDGLSRVLVVAGLTVIGAGAGVHAWLLRRVAASTYSEARKAVDVFEREAS